MSAGYGVLVNRPLTGDRGFATRRCGTSENLKAVSNSLPVAIADEFANHGLDFMSLHPEIHRALLDEALVFGRVERTVEMFFETAALVQEPGLMIKRHRCY